MVANVRITGAGKDWNIRHKRFPFGDDKGKIYIFASGITGSRGPLIFLRIG
jgi:hypothetical protein